MRRTVAVMLGAFVVLLVAVACDSEPPSISGVDESQDLGDPAVEPEVTEPASPAEEPEASPESAPDPAPDPAPEQAEPAPAEPITSGPFEGLSTEAAVELAEAEGRPWRIGREDGEDFALTQDYVVGRVTFEIDDGIVTRAVIEGEPAPQPTPEPTPTPPSLGQADKDWLEAHGRAVGPLVAEAQGAGSEILACLTSAALAASSTGFSECRPLVASNQALLVALRDAVNGLPPSPAALVFFSDAYNEFISEGLEASELALEGFDFAPGSLEQIWLFDQYDLRMKRARAVLFDAAFRLSTLTGQEIPDRIVEGMALDSALWEEETYDPWTAADFEYMKGLEDPEVDFPEMVALAANAGAALDDYLAGLRALPEPEYEPFAEVLQEIVEGYATLSESYAKAVSGFDLVDDQLLTASDQLRAEGVWAILAAQAEVQRLFEAVIAARE